ncbi:hypothetical protein [Clostridioides sp. ZZV15-6597]|uniref:hypothetical protein n=1 Tax=Clostridioides sp. ZZV15-6597 TaxID=2811500 RepID=UPI001D1032F4|nr:hypothetical protein [Clostridioides sp. ZZV15-6597]HBF1820668.1 hypothetical protein [Clostridioides difficile]
MGKGVKETMDFRKRTIWCRVISGMTWIFLGLSFKYSIFNIPFVIFLLLEIPFIFKKPKDSEKIEDEFFENLRQADSVTFDLLKLTLAIFLLVFAVLKIFGILKVSLVDIEMIIAVLLGCINIFHILILMCYEKDSSCIEECKCVSEDE